MTQVSIKSGTHFNKPVAGMFELVQGYTAWGGTADTRRVGTATAGYIKVSGMSNYGDERVFKVSVEGENVGYDIMPSTVVPVVAVTEAEPEVADATPEAVALAAEIAELVAILVNAKGAERAKYRKRLTRREAKLAALEVA